MSTFLRRGTFFSLFFLPAGWNANVMAIAYAALHLLLRQAKHEIGGTWVSADFMKPSISSTLLSSRLLISEKKINFYLA